MIHDYYLYDKESEIKPYRGRTFFKQAGVVKLTLNDNKDLIIFLDEKNNRKLSFSLDEIVAKFKKLVNVLPHPDMGIGIYPFVEYVLGLKKPIDIQRMKLICKDILNN
jgi:hypothetical protein